MTINLWSRAALIGSVLVLASGCAHTSVMGSETMGERVVHGSVGIMGDGNRLTILAGSEVTKLSIMGEDNRVVIEDGASIAKVELVGEDNEVVCPAGESPIYSSIGEDNRLRHRSESGHRSDD